MMKTIAITIAAAAVVAGGPLQAAPKKPNENSKPASEKAGQGQEQRQTERSQGHLHADFDAIANVCGKDNPAATRSALCTPKPVSPQ